jgi:hypothetical protein
MCEEKNKEKLRHQKREENTMARARFEVEDTFKE